MNRIRFVKLTDIALISSAVPLALSARFFLLRLHVENSACTTL